MTLPLFYLVPHVIISSMFPQNSRRPKSGRPQNQVATRYYKNQSHSLFALKEQEIAVLLSVERFLVFIFNISFDWWQRNFL